MPHQDFFKEVRPHDTAAKEAHLTMFRGDTLQFKAMLTEDKMPLDITQSNFWFTVKADLNDDDSAAVISKDSSNGIVVLNGPIGLAQITVDPYDTLILDLEEPTSYYWDLQHQGANGIIRTVFYGDLTIIPDVTRNRGFVVGATTPLVGSGYLDAFGILAGVNPVQDGDGLTLNEVQSIHVDGAYTGTFTLTVEDPNNLGNFETTTPIAWNATGLDIETALETDISFIDDVSVSGAASLDLGAIDVTFDGAGVTLLDFPLMTMDVTALI